MIKRSISARRNEIIIQSRIIKSNESQLFLNFSEYKYTFIVNYWVSYYNLGVEIVP